MILIEDTKSDIQFVKGVLAELKIELKLED